MAREYKVTVDQSLFASNDAGSIEKTMREMDAEGWSLIHVTSITAGGSDNTNTSRIYMFWQRDVAVRTEQPRGDDQTFGALVRKQLGGSSKG